MISSGFLDSQALIGNIFRLSGGIAFILLFCALPAFLYEVAAAWETVAKNNALARAAQPEQGGDAIFVPQLGLTMADGGEKKEAEKTE